MSNWDQLTDEELIKTVYGATKAKANQAYECLWNRYRNKAIVYAIRCGSDPLTAHDIVQECYLTILEQREGVKKGRYDPKCGSFRGWFFWIVHNEVCQRVHRANRYCLGGTIDLANVVSDESTDESACNLEEIRLLRECIATLPEK